MKNNVKKIIYIAVLLALSFSIGRASAATLYLEPGSGERHQGDIFIVEIRIDSETERINTVEAHLDFPQDKLQIVDVGKGGSALVFWAKEPDYSNENGNLSFIGGVPGGFIGKGKIVSIPFLALSTKENEPVFAEIMLSEKSRVFLNDGLGTPADLDIRGSILTILPKDTDEIRDEWQRELERDDTPPEPFEITLAREPSMFDGRYFIAFSAVDNQTGIDYYEVKEGESDWKRAESPYLLKDQSLKSRILVKAVDKAGNERIVELLPQKPFPAQALILALIALIIAAGWLLRSKRIR